MSSKLIIQNEAESIELHPLNSVFGQPFEDTLAGVRNKVPGFHSACISQDSSHVDLHHPFFDQTTHRYSIGAVCAEREVVDGSGYRIEPNYPGVRVRLDRGGRVSFSNGYTITDSR